MKNQDNSTQNNKTNTTGTLISIGGLSGSGKSTLAKALHHDLTQAGHDVILLRSDVIRKTLWGVNETTRLPSEAYTWDHTQKMIDHMHTRATEALQQGKTVITDSLFNFKEARTNQKQLAEKNNARFFGFFLTCDKDTLMSRVEGRTLQNNDASDADVNIMLRQWEALAFDPVTDWPNISSDRPTSEVLNDLKTYMDKKDEKALNSKIKKPSQGQDDRNRTSTPHP